MNVEELEVKTWHPQDGDILVVKNSEVTIDRDQAAEIKQMIRESLNLPGDFRILVVGRDWELGVARET